MISHARAQALVSARMDDALAAADAEALWGHLHGCATCRRFAEQSDALGRGLRALPHLPASPNVSRQVMETVNAGRSPWALLSFGMRLASGPALATVGSLVLVAALAFTVVLALNPPGGDEGGAPTAVDAPLAQQPASDAATTTRVASATAMPATEEIAVDDAPTTAAEAESTRPSRTVAVGSLSPTEVPPTPTVRINVTATHTPTPTGDAAASAQNPTAVPPAPTAVAPTPTPVGAVPPPGVDGGLAPITPTLPPRATATKTASVTLGPTATPVPTLTPGPTATPSVPPAPPPPATAIPTVAIPAGPPPIRVSTAVPTAPSPTVTSAETPPSSIVVVATTGSAETPAPAPTGTEGPSPSAPTPAGTVPMVPVGGVPTAAVVVSDPVSASEVPTAPVSPPIVPVVPRGGQDVGVVGGPAPDPTTTVPAVAPPAAAALPRDDRAAETPSVGMATPVADAAVAAGGSAGEGDPVESDPVRVAPLPIETAVGERPAAAEVDSAVVLPDRVDAQATAVSVETGVVRDATTATAAAAAGAAVPQDGESPWSPVAVATAPSGDVAAAGATSEPPVATGAVEAPTSVPDAATIPPGVATIAPVAAPVETEAAASEDRRDRQERRATREAEPATDALATEGAVPADTSPVAILPTRTLGGDDAFTPVGVVAMENRDGVLVMDPTGGAVTLSRAASPVWSPLGAVLLVTMPNPVTGLPSIAFWERGTADPGPLPESLADEGRYRDVPAGWASSFAYYLRVYEDGSGRIELRADDILTAAGFETIWSGTAAEAGPFGADVSAARVSPDGSRIAFLAGGRLHLAGTADPPGSAVPLPGEVIGFDWSPESRRLAVSDGALLTIYDAAGGTVESGSVARAGWGRRSGGRSASTCRGSTGRASCSSSPPSPAPRSPWGIVGPTAAGGGRSGCRACRPGSPLPCIYLCQYNPPGWIVSLPHC